MSRFIACDLFASGYKDGPSSKVVNGLKTNSQHNTLIFCELSNHKFRFEDQASVPKGIEIHVSRRAALNISRR